MFKDEALVCFVESPEEDRGFPTNEMTIGDGVLAVQVGGEEDHMGAIS
jgi:hypothetical protein